MERPPVANPLDPNHLSPEERLAELGHILAAGLIRLRVGKSSPLSGVAGESYVDLPAPKSGHATCNSGGMTR